MLSAPVPLTVPGLWIVVVIGVVIVVIHRVVYYDSRRKHLPPGPKGLPIIGNSFQISLTNNPEPTLIAWAKKYGEIYYAKIGTTDFVFVNSGRVVKELLDRRGNIYSDKPYLPMAGETVTKNLNLSLMRYDQRWKVSSIVASAYIDSSTIDARNAHSETSRNVPTHSTV